MEQVKDLTIEEIEVLCRLYNECRLSVLEETELEYVLHCTTLSTDLINETKSLMGISRQVTFPKTLVRPKNAAQRKVARWTLGIAASVAIILVGRFSLSERHGAATAQDESYYVAYVEGSRADEETAREMAESEAAKVAEFMQFVENQKATERDKVRQFINQRKK